MPPKPQRRVVRLRDSLRSSSFRVEVKSYCENSSIHGVKYITERHRPNFERMLWSVTVGIALVYAGIYTVDVWEETPILTSEAAVHRNHRVPMPAVTVCSHAKVAKSSNWGQDRTKNKDLHTLRFLCGEAFPNSRSISVKRLRETSPGLERTCSLDLVGEDGVLRQVACSTLFRPVLTEQGLCYSFNSLHPSHLYRPDVLVGELPAGEVGDVPADGGVPACGGREERLLLSLTPEPGSEGHLKCGNHTLKLSMFSSKDDTGYCTFTNLTGFKVLIHNPKDAPSVGIRRLIWTQEESSEFQSITINTETKVTVKAEARLSSHSPDLLWFSPRKRACFGERERYLRYFRSYTRRNCLLECLANLTLSICGCADFYMPHLKGTELCKRVNLPCIFDVIDLFRKKDYCDCYPACYQLDYVIQTRTLNDTGNTEWRWNDSSLTLRLDLNVTELRRKPSFTDLKVISSSGGVFGFFLGLSFISLVELIYFFCIRHCGNCYKVSCQL